MKSPSSGVKKFFKHCQIVFFFRMKSFLSIVALIATLVTADNHHHHGHHGENHHHEAAHPQEDHHMHDSQIPSPEHMPSQEDVVSMLNEVFSLIDKDSDKQISGEELKNWLDKIHKDMIDESVKQQWQYHHPQVTEVHTWESYDPESKETLSWEEYVKTTYPEDVVKHVKGEKVDLSEAEKDPNFHSYVLMYKRSEKRWNAADKNNDKFLTKEEFRYFIHPEEGEHTKKILVDEALSDIDKDKNGEVTLEEYIHHMNEVTPAEDKEDDFDGNSQSDFQTYLDKNKDGSLDKEELTEWLAPEYDKHEAESYRMIQESDTNHDQKLSRDEILENDEHFLSLIPAEFWRRFENRGTTPMPAHDEF